MMPNRNRFLADANVDGGIIKGLKRLQPNIEFHSANEMQLEGVPDPEVLAIAAGEGYILITHDLRTMPQHFGDFLASGQHSPGVILVPQSAPMGAILDTLLLIWSASDPQDWLDRIDRIPW
jgi:hypothetical protein